MRFWRRALSGTAASVCQAELLLRALRARSIAWCVFSGVRVSSRRGCRCIAGVISPLPAQPSWQMLEVLLFAVRGVVPAVRSRMPGGRLPDAISGAVRCPPHRLLQ